MNKRTFLTIILICAFIPLHLVAGSLSQFQDRYEQLEQQATTGKERVEALLKILESISSHEDVWFEDFDTLYNAIDREAKDLIDADNTLEKYEVWRLGIAQLAESNGITVTLKQTTSLLKRIKLYFTKNRKKIIIGGLTAVGIAATYIYFSRKIAAENTAALQTFVDQYQASLDTFENDFGEKAFEEIKSKDESGEFQDARNTTRALLDTLESDVRNLKISLKSKSFAQELRANVKTLHTAITDYQYKLGQLRYESPTERMTHDEKVAYHTEKISKEQQELSDLVSEKQRDLKDLDPSDPAFTPLVDDVSLKLAAARRTLDSKYHDLIDYVQLYDHPSKTYSYKRKKRDYWSAKQKPKSEFTSPPPEILKALNEFDTTIKTFEAMQKAFKLPGNIRQFAKNIDSRLKSELQELLSKKEKMLFDLKRQGARSRYEDDIAKLERYKADLTKYATEKDTKDLKPVIEKLEEKLKAHATELDDIEQNWSQRTLPTRVTRAHETFTQGTSNLLRMVKTQYGYQQQTLKTLVRTIQAAQRKAAEFKKETEQLGDQTPKEAVDELKRYEESIKNIDAQVIELERKFNAAENQRKYTSFKNKTETFLAKAEAEDLAALSDADFQRKYEEYEQKVERFKLDADRHAQLVPENATKIEQIKTRLTTLKDYLKNRYVLAKKKEERTRCGKKSIPSLKEAII